MPARDMAAYMRKRRAKQRAERGAAVRADTALPSKAIAQVGGGEIAIVKADIAAIQSKGGRALITKVDARLRAIDARCAATPARSPMRRIEPASPRSMVAIGGRAGTGRPVPGYDPDREPHDPYAVLHRVNTVAMLQTLAAQVDANTREIAALQAAAADRRARAADIAQALFSAMRVAFLDG